MHTTDAVAWIDDEPRAEAAHEAPAAGPRRKLRGEAGVDQELVERAQRGDKQAFDMLVRRYQHKIVKVVSRYVADQDEVMDIAQEAFVRAYRAIERFRAESAFYTWLYRIAVNAAKNYLVATGRRPPSDDIDAQDAEQYDGVAALKEYDTPEALTYRSEVETALSQAVAELPEDLHTALTLREVQGMTYQEIAHAMECPVGTVRSRIFRARENIDKRLRPLLS